MKPSIRKPNGPFTVWTSYGIEGWQFEDFNTIEDAIRAHKMMSEWVVMAPVDWQIVIKEKAPDVSTEG